MQGAGAALAGAVAQWSSPGAAMATMAVISLAVTLLLARGLREETHGEGGEGERGPRPLEVIPAVRDAA
jgi:hypothetical protein